MAQRAFRRAGLLRSQCFQDRVGLRVQSGSGGGPKGVITAFFLAPAASDERPETLVVQDRHEAYLADNGFTGVE
jgi:hypothetical protein